MIKLNSSIFVKDLDEKVRLDVFLANETELTMEKPLSLEKNKRLAF